MRIVVSNPDHLGDLTLREPLFCALSDAGHQLLLVVRDFVAPFVRDMVPDAQIAVCPGDPYASGFRLDTPLGLQLKTQIERFEPELLVVAPYQFTALEQQIAAWLPGVETIGFTGRLFQSIPHSSAVETIRFTQRVQVSTEAAETAKNELLCAAILPNVKPLRAPRLTVSESGRKLAAEHLRRVGLAPGTFWAVCAADRPPLGFKNWERDKWVELLRTLVERHDIRILFIGNEEEHQETLAIQAALGRAALRSATVTGQPITVSEVIGLIDASLGYLGKDTGPMHFAAALGKPVLTVFGGGTWPRFVPQARTGVLFTLDVPCTGCEYFCPMERPYCVKDVPLAPVLEAAERMILGQEEPFHVELIPLDAMQQAKIFRDLQRKTEEAVQTQTAERGRSQDLLAGRDREIAVLNAAVASEIAVRHRELDEASRRIRRLELENAVLHASTRELREDRASLTARLGSVSATAHETAASRFPQEPGRLVTVSSNGAPLGPGATLADLERDVQAKALRITKLQTHIDTVEGTSRGRVADLEKSLAQQRGDKELTLCLIPELRDEVAAFQREIGDLKAGLRRFAGRVQLSDGDPRVLLETAAGLFLDARQQLDELSARLREATGDRVGVDGWRDRLSLLEADAENGRAASREMERVTGELAELTQWLRLAAGLESTLNWRELTASLNDVLQRGRQMEDLVEQAQRNRSRLEADKLAVAAALESSLSRERTLEAEVADVTRRLQVAAGTKASGRGWREDMRIVETDRFERLGKVQELAQRLQGKEEVLANWAEQIDALHVHIGNLHNRFDALEARLPVRLLRSLRII